MHIIEEMVLFPEPQPVQHIELDPQRVNHDVIVIRFSCLKFNIQCHVYLFFTDIFQVTQIKWSSEIYRRPNVKYIFFPAEPLSRVMAWKSISDPLAFFPPQLSFITCPSLLHNGLSRGRSSQNCNLKIMSFFRKKKKSPRYLLCVCVYSWL